MTSVEETSVIIVGAGLSGLSTAVSLHKLEIPYIILEREDCIASLFNKKAYDRLHLHLAKQYCQLAHMPFPSNYPTYVSRNDFLKYLDDYASHFNIKPKFGNMHSTDFKSERRTRTRRSGGRKAVIRVDVTSFDSAFGGFTFGAT
ncbi:probable indole-3-pyruvate monooxygenase YUCCA10 [Tanacetum coccineum]|uniref:indole-3-pyruvate monooxygenase n=1 Tax=Tanacetum coccineum TaxID=301880 RepID=A0ABQ4WD07_9ASTR